MQHNRRSSPSSSPNRVRAHRLAQYGATGRGGLESVTALLRSYNVGTNPTRPVRPSPLTASTISDLPIDIVDRIRSFPFFASAPEVFISAIVGHLHPQVHSAQDRIITEGDEAKAMYWLVRGVVAVTSRDGEAVYALLKPGAFFGEIGVLMNIPRTATIVARIKCLVVALKKEDLQAELLKFPDMETAIRQEAEERLAILNKSRQERRETIDSQAGGSGPSLAHEVTPSGTGVSGEGAAINHKKRKSPSPGLFEDPAVSGCALASGHVNIRKTLRELPLFSTLPAHLLHMLGLSAQLKTYPPFAEIIREGTIGQEVFFIIRGEAEVVREMAGAQQDAAGFPFLSPSLPRLKETQYFGEVTSLGMAAVRTATVRAITKVECLMISGEAMAELWRLCPAEIKTQVEETARRRCRSTGAEEDAPTTDEDEGARRQGSGHPAPPSTPPPATYSVPPYPASPSQDEAATRQAADPDPYLSVETENIRNRQLHSLPPQTPPSSMDGPSAMYIKGDRKGSPLKYVSKPPSPPEYDEEATRARFKKAKIGSDGTMSVLHHMLLKANASPDDALVKIFAHLSLVDMLRMRAVCRTWHRVLCERPELCRKVDLTPISRLVTDWSIIHVIAPFIGERPREIDIGNCFHIKDKGFQALWRRCGKNVRRWKMRSVWDVSAGQILEMTDNVKKLEEVDWSNCRKVSDNLLVRVVGWVVPDVPPPPPLLPESEKASKGVPQQQGSSGASAAYAMPPPGTVIGSPGLRRINLSYCKHITDRSMMHLAAHASSRIESLTLTRCGSITDHGFQAWGAVRFHALTHLCLADCTYLTDASMVALARCAKNLRSLDLSFCCRLSDEAIETVAMELRELRELRLAFCGNAVSDLSLGYVGIYLEQLRGLSVRGCVRVTGMGVEPMLKECRRLEWLDVSQCKNLAWWLAEGGVDRWGFDERDRPGGTYPDTWDDNEDVRDAPRQDPEGGDHGRGTDESMRRAGPTGPAGWIPRDNPNTAGHTTVAPQGIMVAGPPLASAAGVPRILPSNADWRVPDAGGSGYGKLLGPFCPSPGPRAPTPSSSIAIPSGTGTTSQRTKKPVRFIIQKAGGLR